MLSLRIHSETPSAMNPAAKTAVEHALKEHELKMSIEKTNKELKSMFSLASDKDPAKRWEFLQTFAKTMVSIEVPSQTYAELVTSQRTSKPNVRQMDARSRYFSCLAWGIDSMPRECRVSFANVLRKAERARVRSLVDGIDALPCTTCGQTEHLVVMGATGFPVLTPPHIRDDQVDGPWKAWWRAVVRENHQFSELPLEERRRLLLHWTLRPEQGGSLTRRSDLEMLVMTMLDTTHRSHVYWNHYQPTARTTRRDVAAQAAHVAQMLSDDVEMEMEP